ncbi:DHH family phosphoesterase [Effusibacillus lacus]|uniref:Exopolyphosphatase n=1 Tax=Effusibacillus lacus TaxID=1348429 RepID=A0A292YQ08_9BACL|nr:bifunctional oligoribonuclease/PAP phosphatase NrnA [Effusibacillus lacus]TCS73166.1 phosphoesterase RecJ-like protein [Effusibacillus lacus]GAX90570.1 exopolyphosphatase [Effusibacillus lacus]
MDRRQMLQEASDFILQNDDFLLITHVQPDGDALGSTLGFAHLLQALGKRYAIAVEEPIPAKFRFLPMSDRIQLASQISRRFSKIVALDCGDIKRFGRCAEFLEPQADILNIDHHKTNDCFGRANLVDLEAAATSQIVFNLASFMGTEIGRDMSVCLYTGILTDTGGFRYGNTTVEVHTIAAELLRNGVSPYDVADRVLETLTWSQLQLIREGLKSLQKDELGKVAWMVVERDLLDRLGAGDEDAEGLVSYARNVQGVEVGILFREKADGTVKASLRSKYHVDVGEIALSLGGGGHARAAGCTLAGPVDKAVAEVLLKVRESLPS